jgi:putative membrane protein
MAMGISDLIPGISGGTIALITGVYNDFITSLNNLNIKNIKSIFNSDIIFQLKKHKFDFLIFLALGIISSILIFSKIISNLLTNYPQEISSFFFGLILASIPFILKGTKIFTLNNLAFLIGSILITSYLLGLNNINGEISLIYIFICGFFCSCAMILPGISGAYILLIFSSYDFILEKLNTFLADFNFDDFVWIGVFILGILTGVLTFSRFVKYLLQNHKNKTILSLSGLIIGSLPKLFPFEITELDIDSLISNSTIIICFCLGIFLLIGINFMSKNEKQ